MPSDIVEDMAVYLDGESVRNPLPFDVRIGESGGHVGDVLLVSGYDPFAESA